MRVDRSRRHDRRRGGERRGRHRISNEILRRGSRPPSQPPQLPSGSARYRRSAALAACSSPGGQRCAVGRRQRRAHLAPSAARPLSAAAQLYATRRRAPHVQLGRVCRRSRTSRSSRLATTSRLTYDIFASNEELLAKLHGGAIRATTSLAPTAEYVQVMAGRATSSSCDLRASRTRRSSTPAFKNHGPMGPEQRLPRPQGLGHDRDRRPQEARDRRRSRRGSSSSRSPRASTPARSSSSTRRATSCRPAQGARLLAELDRPDRARGGRQLLLGSPPPPRARLRQLRRQARHGGGRPWSSAGPGPLVDLRERRDGDDRVHRIPEEGDALLDGHVGHAHRRAASERRPTPG